MSYCHNCEEHERQTNSLRVEVDRLIEKLNLQVSERVKAESEYQMLVTLIGDDKSIYANRGKYERKTKGCF